MGLPWGAAGWVAWALRVLGSCKHFWLEQRWKSVHVDTLYGTCYGGSVFVRASLDCILAIGVTTVYVHPNTKHSLQSERKHKKIIVWILKEDTNVLSFFFSFSQVILQTKLSPKKNPKKKVHMLEKKTLYVYDLWKSFVYGCRIELGL